MRNLKNGLIIFSACIIALLLGEILLRIFGAKTIYSQRDTRFVPVENIFLYNDFTVDSFGIFHLSESAYQSIHQLIKDPALDFANLMQRQSDITLKYVTLAYSSKLKNDCDLQKLCNTNTISGVGNVGEESVIRYLCNMDCNSPYLQFIDSLKLLSKRDSFQNALIEQFENYPINQNGFRTVNFNSLTSKHERKRVLVIGDSFTFGYASVPVISSFTDIMSISNRYEVINLGIPGADPAQYLKIVEVYSALLKPDWIIVAFNFEMENDIMYYDRQAKPFTYFIYPSNGGWLPAYTQNGKHLATLNAAYQHSLSLNHNQFKNNPLSKTVIGSNVLYAWEKLTATTDDVMPPDSKEVAMQRTNTVLKKMAQVAKQNSAGFFLAILPMQSDTAYSSLEKYSSVLQNINYHHQAQNTSDDFSGLGMHLSNKGHYKFGNYLVSVLDSLNK